MKLVMMMIEGGDDGRIEKKGQRARKRRVFIWGNPALNPHSAFDLEEEGSVECVPAKAMLARVLEVMMLRREGDRG